KNVLRAMLPKRWGIGTGFVIFDKEVSFQTDILIYDYTKIPAIYTGYEMNIIPIQSLAATIEVKTNINGEKDIIGAKHYSAKIGELYNNIKDEHKGETEPINILFGYGSKNKITTIAQ
uniref:DUF6602 domain-containing protein n=1 Tax=Klebsiella pneumoniae TaxID=573 RepID=UPI003B97F449